MVLSALKVLAMIGIAVLVVVIPAMGWAQSGPIDISQAPQKIKNAAAPILQIITVIAGVATLACGVGMIMGEADTKDKLRGIFKGLFWAFCGSSIITLLVS